MNKLYTWNVPRVAIISTLAETPEAASIAMYNGLINALDGPEHVPGQRLRINVLIDHVLRHPPHDELQPGFVQFVWQ